MSDDLSEPTWNIVEPVSVREKHAVLNGNDPVGKLDDAGVVCLHHRRCATLLLT